MDFGVPCFRLRLIFSLSHHLTILRKNPIRLDKLYIARCIRRRNMHSLIVFCLIFVARKNRCFWNIDLFCCFVRCTAMPCRIAHNWFAYLVNTKRPLNYIIAVREWENAMSRVIAHNFFYEFFILCMQTYYEGLCNIHIHILRDWIWVLECFAYAIYTMWRRRHKFIAASNKINRFTTKRIDRLIDVFLHQFIFFCNR